MQRKSPVLPITILLGVLALGATAFLLLAPKTDPNARPDGAAQAAAPTPKPVERWVAARDIPPRTVITEAMMRRDFSTGAAPEGAVTSLDEVRGQLTREPISAGEPVLASSFAPRIKRKVDANISIPSGYRGVAIWVDPNQTAAGLVDVGDRIDVISTHKLTNPVTATQRVIGAITFTAGRTIAQNLLVLGVDESIKAVAPTPTPLPGAAAAAGGPPPPPPPPTAPTPVPAVARIRVLVAATPDIAARLVAANDQGLLNVTIRNPNDGDAGLINEVREYPSRVVYVAPPNSGGSGNSGSGNGGNGNGGNGNSGSSAAERRAARNALREEMQPSRAIRQLSPVATPIPFPTVAPANPNPFGSRPANTSPSGTGGTGMTAPDAPSTKEITVIRGTEKTRVIVPLR